MGPLARSLGPLGVSLALAAGGGGPTPPVAGAILGINVAVGSGLVDYIGAYPMSLTPGTFGVTGQNASYEPTLDLSDMTMLARIRVNSTAVNNAAIFFLPTYYVDASNDFGIGVQTEGPGSPQTIHILALDSTGSFPAVSCSQTLVAGNEYVFAITYGSSLVKQYAGGSSSGADQTLTFRTDSRKVLILGDATGAIEVLWAYVYPSVLSPTDVAAFNSF